MNKFKWKQFSVRFPDLRDSGMRLKMLCLQKSHCRPQNPEAWPRAGFGPRTCDGLEEVSVVLQVVVAIVVIGPFTEGTALLVGHEVLPQRRLQVGRGFLQLLLGVEVHSQPKLVLLGGRGTQMQGRLRTALPPCPRPPPRASPWPSQVTDAKGACYTKKACWKRSLLGQSLHLTFF